MLRLKKIETFQAREKDGWNLSEGAKTGRGWRTLNSIELGLKDQMERMGGGKMWRWRSVLLIRGFCITQRKRRN